MAHMYPEHLPQLTGAPNEHRRSDSERRVYNLLANRLSDAFTVMYGVPWLAKSPKTGASDGEIDFLIAHPDRGLLIIEVKGGGIHYDGRTEEWTSTDRHGDSHDIDPFRQARRQFYALRDKLRESRGTKQFAYPLGRAVWFPDLRIKHDLRIDAPREIILDADDCIDPAQAIFRLYSYWDRPEQAGDFRSIRGGQYGDEAIRALIALLAPTFEVRVRLGTRFMLEQAGAKGLTEVQFRYLDVLARARRAVISGCAGSGKTLLALEKAQRLSREGFRVLLVCYNRNLAHWLEERVGRDPGITVRTFHKLCEDFANNANVPLPKTREGREYFDITLPNALFDAAMRCPDLRFDAIVVDEGQDFDRLWWTALSAALRDDNEGILYIFYDDNQKLYQARESEYPVNAQPLSLPTNCRNTQAIHEATMKFYRGIIQVDCDGEPGHEVKVFRPGQGDSEADILRKELHRLIYDEGVNLRDIIILTPKRVGSQWRDGMRLGNFSLRWGLTSPAHNAIPCTTIQSFKGLERPVVFVTELAVPAEVASDALADAGASPGAIDYSALASLRTNDSEALAYVAFSRATNYLVIIEPQPYSDEDSGDIPF